jgi:glycopeptide antibiotics resistance protein
VKPMNNKWTMMAWIGLMVNVIITIKFTWMRENIALMYTQLKSFHLASTLLYLESYRCNLVPFQTIGYYLYGSKSLWISSLNLIGNLAAFVPFGFMIPIIVANGEKGVGTIIRVREAIQVILISFGFSLLIEIGQLVMEVGAFDVDDLILNTLGGYMGYMLFPAAKAFKKVVWERAAAESVITETAVSR